MPSLTIELPPQPAQTAFNLRRWDELLSDPEVAKLEFRVETDRYGNLLMSPPPAPNHGALQAEFAHLLRTQAPGGRVLTECPISTADGVRAADVAWASAEAIAALGNRSCFPRSPEICVEILSPRNSEGEIDHKVALYFDAGAKEVWVCDSFGNLVFFNPGPAPLARSGLCPSFPAKIELG